VYLIGFEQSTAAPAHTSRLAGAAPARASGTLIQPEVCWRVMRHRTRGSPPEVDPERKGGMGGQPP
jgi:hypothetical protein